LSHGRAAGRMSPNETGEPSTFPSPEVDPMGRRTFHAGIRPRARAWVHGFQIVVALTLLMACHAAVATAAVTGKIQGKIVGSDTGDPIAFADVALVPADSTQHVVGGLTNADGTYLLEAPPGRYTLKLRALSYATKKIEGITIEAGKLLPLSTA